MTVITLYRNSKDDRDCTDPLIGDDIFVKINFSVCVRFYKCIWNAVIVREENTNTTNVLLSSSLILHQLWPWTECDNCYYILHNYLLLIRIYFLFDIRYLEIEWDMEFFTEPHKNTSHWDPSRQQGRLVNSCYANCRYVVHIIHLNVKL